MKLRQGLQAQAKLVLSVAVNTIILLFIYVTDFGVIVLAK